LEQVNDLAKTSIIQSAWRQDQKIHIHGWVYDVADGFVKDLGINLTDNNSLQEVYQLDMYIFRNQFIV